MDGQEKQEEQEEKGVSVTVRKEVEDVLGIVGVLRKELCESVKGASVVDDIVLKRDKIVRELKSVGEEVVKKLVPGSVQDVYKIDVDYYTVVFGVNRDGFTRKIATRERGSVKNVFDIVSEMPSKEGVMKFFDAMRTVVVSKAGYKTKKNQKYAVDRLERLHKVIMKYFDELKFLMNDKKVSVDLGTAVALEKGEGGVSVVECMLSSSFNYGLSFTGTETEESRLQRGGSGKTRLMNTLRNEKSVENVGVVALLVMAQVDMKGGIDEVVRKGRGLLRKWEEVYGVMRREFGQEILRLKLEEMGGV